MNSAAAGSDGKTFVLAIDLGSGGPKAALFSDRGELVARASARTATYYTPDGGGEQNPDEWWQTTTACVRQIV